MVQYVVLTRNDPPACGEQGGGKIEIYEGAHRRHLIVIVSIALKNKAGVVDGFGNGREACLLPLLGAIMAVNNKCLYRIS